MTQPSHGTSGAVRRFAGWVARGSVGYPLFEGGLAQGHPKAGDYWKLLGNEPSSMETLFAIFLNNLQLDAEGEPINEKYAERRAATFLFEYLTGKLPEGEPEINHEFNEAQLY